MVVGVAPTCRGRWWICHLLGVCWHCFWCGPSSHVQREPTQAAGLLCAFRLQRRVELFVMCFSLSPWWSTTHSHYYLARAFFLVWCVLVSSGCLLVIIVGVYWAHVYRGPPRGPCIDSIYTHPSRVGGIEQLFPSLVFMTFGRTICKHFHSPIYGGSKKGGNMLINELYWL